MLLPLWVVPDPQGSHRVCASVVPVRRQLHKCLGSDSWDFWRVRSCKIGNSDLPVNLIKTTGLDIARKWRQLIHSFSPEHRWFAPNGLLVLLDYICTQHATLWHECWPCASCLSRRQSVLTLKNGNFRKVVGPLRRFRGAPDFSVDFCVLWQKPV